MELTDEWIVIIIVAIVVGVAAWIVAEGIWLRMRNRKRRKAQR